MGSPCNHFHLSEKFLFLDSGFRVQMGPKKQYQQFKFREKNVTLTHPTDHVGRHFRPYKEDF